MNCRVIRSHHPRHAPPGAIVTVRVLGRSGVFFLIAVTAVVESSGTSAGAVVGQLQSGCIALD